MEKSNEELLDEYTRLIRSDASALETKMQILERMRKPEIKARSTDWSQCPDDDDPGAFEHGDPLSNY